MLRSFDGAASSVDTVLELPKVLVEGRMYVSPVLQAFQYMSAPRGSGSPVLMLPGFGAHDASLWPLGLVMKAKSHDPYDWKQGINLGPRFRPLENAEKVLQDIYEETGQPVTLIGQSLGGAYSMALASRNPEMVERIVTLGSPINPKVLTQLDELVSGTVRKFFDGLNPPDHPDVLEFMEASMDFIARQDELGIPSTSVYSNGDGIVGMAAAINPNESPISENIQVHGSHVGMGLNPITQAVVLNRAAQQAGEHTPMDLKAFWKLLPQKPFHMRDDKRSSWTLENDALVVA